MKGYLLVNFGGPRNLKEIAPFLQNLLTDEDVIRPAIPKTFHKLLFSYIAKKRAKSIEHDYLEIGGKSPIYQDTQDLASQLEKKLNAPVFTFHRYLTETHKATLSLIEQAPFNEIYVFPLFPQFSYATTGSVARFFLNNLSQKSINKLKWVKSYPSATPFISLWQSIIKDCLRKNNLKEEESCFLFSAHGLPEKFITEGDPYAVECRLTFEKVTSHFPKACSRLCFQSQFGKEKWLDPSTKHLCETVLQWHEGRKNILFVPISFTSDHIETLFEIEKSYMPLIRQAGLEPYRVPACYPNEQFADTIVSLLSEFTPLHTSMLVRRPVKTNSAI